MHFSGGVQPCACIYDFLFRGKMKNIARVRERETFVLDYFLIARESFISRVGVQGSLLYIGIPEQISRLFLWTLIKMYETCFNCPGTAAAAAAAGRFTGTH